MSPPEHEPYPDPRRPGWLYRCGGQVYGPFRSHDLTAKIVAVHLSTQHDEDEEQSA